MRSAGSTERRWRQSCHPGERGGGKALIAAARPPLNEVLRAATVPLPPGGAEKRDRLTSPDLHMASRCLPDEEVWPSEEFVAIYIRKSAATL